MGKCGIYLLIAASSVACLHAQSNAPSSARLAARNGVVEVERGNVWVPIAAGDLLNTGDRIRTGIGSSAAVEAGQGKFITLNERSEVAVLDSIGSPLVKLESGSMKVFATSDIQVASKDAILESAERPLDMELGYQGDALNLTVFKGAVRSGGMTVRGAQESTVRTYTAGQRPSTNGNVVANPTIYIYPYFMYGNTAPNSGSIVPPVVNHPTNPGYRPTQIVPPMTDPIRPPVTKP